MKKRIVRLKKLNVTECSVTQKDGVWEIEIVRKETEKIIFPYKEELAPIFSLNKILNQANVKLAIDTLSDGCQSLQSGDCQIVVFCKS